MDATDCDGLVAAILAECDTPASRRLVLDAWGHPDRAGQLRALLGWVRDHVEAERLQSLRGGFCEPVHKAGGVRGPCERPAGVACWWLGRRETATKTLPATGWCGAGERLPKEARWWCVEGQGYWWRLPANGGA